MLMKKNSKTSANPNITAGELYSFELFECKQGGFGIKLDGREMLLRRGKPFWSPGRVYAEQTLKILAEGGPEHFQKNRALVCHACTLFIDFSAGIVAPKAKPLAAFKRSPGYYASLDPIHALCAGPEVVDQLERLEPYLEFCADRGISRPSWSQGGVFHPDNTTDIGKIVQANSHASAVPFNVRYFETLEREFLQLSQPQIAVMHTYFKFCGGFQGHPFVLPLLLVKGLCSPKEFANGFLATLCIIPGVFGDVSARAYKSEAAKIERDAERALFFLKNH